MAKPSHRKGELLALSSGGTTYYQCSGLYRALVDLNLGELAEQYCRQAAYRQGTLDALNKGLVTIEQINEMEASGAFSHRDISDQGFGNYLINRGYLQLVMIDEVHCGAGFSPDIVRESANARAQSLSQLSGGFA
ncbi:MULTISPECIES: hypothetical protein [Halomonadaceae]|jgi:hypothetical protein|uniref:Uncharacterized protein n=1 Tax=Vreelandella aquamarina TaxID=77097 RepID=A0A1N6K4G6_9GAMM|nr:MULTISPECIES: hypothetical protein [Halomonas]MAG53893.1 hypothetical protein [Halomonas sp.]MCC4288176.1 hypothetical protein [Halomonas meridiana]MCD1651754.1 hypothetical protein [Halomonas axialensis]MCD2088993.1 hypothetical protein [Halomonas meridiana]MCO7243567.1 hypothetical protein [Halomonas sp. Ps84H-12]|tara:strand:- start:693 stop:1097 length:405 start_codon:yes stop_codon:yes gene_type:complete